MKRSESFYIAFLLAQNATDQGVFLDAMNNVVIPLGCNYGSIIFFYEEEDK
jgi:hypothetical protein